MWHQLFLPVGYLWSLTCYLTLHVLHGSYWLTQHVPVHVLVIAFVIMFLVCERRLSTVFALCLGLLGLVYMPIFAGIAGLFAAGCFTIALVFWLGWVPHTALAGAALWTLNPAWLPYGVSAYLQHTLVFFLPLAIMLIKELVEEDIHASIRYEENRRRRLAPLNLPSIVPAAVREAMPSLPQLPPRVGSPPASAPIVPPKPRQATLLVPVSVAVRLPWALITHALKTYNPQPTRQKGGQRWESHQDFLND